MSGDEGQTTPPTASEQIDQTVAQDQINAVMGAIGLNPLGSIQGQLLRQVGAGSGGGGYDFSPAQVDAAISQFENIIDKAGKVQEEMMNLSGVVPQPAADGPSGRQANAALKSVAEAQTHNRMLMNYARSYLVKLQAAKAAYEGAEATNSGNAQRQM